MPPKCEAATLYENWKPHTLSGSNRISRAFVSLGYHPDFIVSKELRALRQRVNALGFLCAISSIYDLSSAIGDILNIGVLVPADGVTGPELPIPTLIAFIFTFELIHYLLLYFSEFTFRGSEILALSAASIEEKGVTRPTREPLELVRIRRGVESERDRWGRKGAFIASLRFIQDIAAPLALALIVLINNIHSMVEAAGFVASSLL